ncbi:MAG TPA: DUF2628 domain-containing protein [Hyphomicrobiaceae bacterium]|jgi:hypothetical protein|nr:DUF2628 domain-containing protein [Hyphomicrobiaceae bacterium]
MRTFTVHEAPDPPADRIDRAAGLAFVRDGFSWSAALFTPIWLLAYRLWWPLLGYLVAAVLIDLGRQSGLFHAGWLSLAWAALHLLIGFEADTLRRWQLAQRGWLTLGSVSGRSAEDCERRFFDMWLPTQPVIAHPAPGAAATARRSLLGALSGAHD